MRIIKERKQKKLIKAEEKLDICDLNLKQDNIHNKTRKETKNITNRMEIKENSFSRSKDNFKNEYEQKTELDLKENINRIKK